MSERTRNHKDFAQDAAGVFFCGVGGFFAVSIVLFLNGQEPKPGLISALTWPVTEMVGLVGAGAALVFSAGLAALGTILFLRTTPFSALWPLAALVSGVLGLSLLLGAFTGGGAAGALLPDHVAGFAGQTLGVVLGLTLVWLGWTLLPAQRRAHANTADAMQRIGLSARHDAASGVSSAEAALLVNEPRGATARPIPQRQDQAPRTTGSLRSETIRPLAATKEAPSRRVEASASPIRPPASAAIRPVGKASVGVPPPPAPSWETSSKEREESAEADEEPERAEDEAPDWNDADWKAAEELEGGGLGTEEPADFPAPRGLGADATLADVPQSELEEEPEEEGLEESEQQEQDLAGLGLESAELDAPEEDPEEDSVREPVAPQASWEQVGLFDEEEEEIIAEESAEPTSRAELTPTFDFGQAGERKPRHEPEASEDDPFAAPAGLIIPEVSPARVKSAPEHEPKGSRPTPDYTLEPAAVPAQAFAPAKAPRPTPVVAGEDEAERWNQLVFEAGCAILEQKRVAVSMLERHFGIDFDQSCRVLDELQAAGLIGPYMGGRTRDILLTREEWLPHAPNAS